MSVEVSPRVRIPSHPAKFSTTVLECIAQYLNPLDLVLDPFGGVGGIHRLDCLTRSLEIEHAWVLKSREYGISYEGDAQHLSTIFAPHDFDAIVTSPTYGNRMADHHEARDGSKRFTYRHSLGRPLSENNSGAMQWGDEYREFHADVWRQCVELLRPGGLFILNIKDHRRKGVAQDVPYWHRMTLKKLGLDFQSVTALDTPGMGFGANQAKANKLPELVYVFRKPIP